MHVDLLCPTSGLTAGWTPQLKVGSSQCANIPFQYLHTQIADKLAWLLAFLLETKISSDFPDMSTSV